MSGKVTPNHRTKMLFSELSKLTKGECTQEEYDAVNAVYMTLDDMTKEDAAKLWKKLYAKKHREARKAADAKSREIDRLYEEDDYSTGCTLPNGDGIIIEVVSRRLDGWANHRNFYVRKGMRKVLIATERYANITPADGNPYKLTRNGKVLA